MWQILHENPIIEKDLVAIVGEDEELKSLQNGHIFLGSLLMPLQEHMVPALILKSAILGEDLVKTLHELRAFAKAPKIESELHVAFAGIEISESFKWTKKINIRTRQDFRKHIENLPPRLVTKGGAISLEREIGDMFFTARIPAQQIIFKEKPGHWEKMVEENLKEDQDLLHSSSAFMQLAALQVSAPFLHLCSWWTSTSSIASALMGQCYSSTDLVSLDDFVLYHAAR